MFMNEEGAYGCAQCTQPTVSAPLLELTESKPFRSFLGVTGVGKRILMIPEQMFYVEENLLQISTSTRIAALIVYEGDGPRVSLVESEVSENFPFPPLVFPSVDDSEPNRNHNFYDDITFLDKSNQSIHRNDGNGVKFRFFPFNIFRVDAATANEIRKRAKDFPDEDDSDNQNLDSFKPRYKIESLGKMYACPTDTSGLSEINEDNAGKISGNLKDVTSSSCIKNRTCLPIGGHSVWSALHRLDPTVTERRILAVTAPMDSMGFFYQLAPGASAEIASLAVLMAVAESVAKYANSSESKDRDIVRQPVYFAWNAQAWGYAGSSRFLKDLKEFKCKTEADASKFEPGCKDPFMTSLKFLEMKGADFSVLNIGQLIFPNTTKGTDTDNKGFFSHRKPNTSSTGIDEALDSSFMEFGSEINLTTGAGNLLPIDASQSFQKYMPQAEVVSISNYDEKFKNKRYHTIYDNETLTRFDELRKPLYLVAKGIAKTVINLAFRDDNATVEINNETIDQIILCLAEDWSKCELARTYIGKDEYEISLKEIILANNYPGTFFPEPIATRVGNGRNPSAAARLSFVRKFFAYHNRNSVKGNTVKCKVDEDCKDFGDELNRQFKVETQAALRNVVCTRGICVSSDTYLHNAYGTAFEPNNDIQTSFTFNGNDEALDGSNPREGGWTESSWDIPFGLCGFVEDTTTYGGLILGVSIIFFLICVFLAWWIDWQIFKPLPEIEGTPDETRPLAPA